MPPAISEGAKDVGLKVAERTSMDFELLWDKGYSASKNYSIIPLTSKAPPRFPAVIPWFTERTMRLAI
jgi:hypothetical protein